MKQNQSEIIKLLQHGWILEEQMWPFQIGDNKPTTLRSVAIWDSKLESHRYPVHANIFNALMRNRHLEEISQHKQPFEQGGRKFERTYIRYQLKSVGP